MKRFITLLLLFFYFFGNAQNLIPNPGADDYIFCPTELGGGNQTFPGDPWVVDDNIIPWKTWRNSPDYFNICANELEFPLGSLNPAGYQEPLTGSGYIGLITYIPGLINYREFVGITIQPPLEIGTTYELSFSTSVAFSSNGSTRATNKVGALLMENHYLDSIDFGALPNFAQLYANEIISDTTIWTSLSSIFVADSNYQYLAFGNFFEDTLTENEILYNGEEGGYSYYYLDNFCLIPLGGSCDLNLFQNENFHEIEIELYPNPATNVFQIRSDLVFQEATIQDFNGRIFERLYLGGKENTFIDISGLRSGIYLLHLKTEEGVNYVKRFIVTP